MVKKAAKRPVNAFLLFSSERRKTIAKDQPKLLQKKILKQLGAEWKQMGEKDQAPFKKEAKKLLDAYHELLEKEEAEAEAEAVPEPEAKEAKWSCWLSWYFRAFTCN